MRALLPLLPSVQVLSVQQLPVFAHVSQAFWQKATCGVQSPHPMIPLNMLPQVQVFDFEQQRKIAQSLLAQKMTEVTQLVRALQDSIANPAEVACISGL